MFLLKLRTAAATLITITTLAAGAQLLLSGAKAHRPEPNLEQIRAELGAQNPVAADRARAVSETAPPPQNLAWTDVAPADRLRVIDQLATQSRGNFKKIKTWQGAYGYVLHQYLDEKYAAQLRGGALALADKPAPQEKSGPLMQEFDSTLTFAIDMGKDSIYRDIETSRMRFLKVGTNEEILIPNVGAPDHRSIVTPESYYYFLPKERATSRVPARSSGCPDETPRRSLPRSRGPDA